MKQELKVSEINQIKLRQSLIQTKQQEIQKLTLEAQIIESSLKHYYSSLLDVYKLDKKKQYNFDGQHLVEIEEENVQPNKKIQKSKK